ncbi:MAG TPA: VWA domain-containing protein, partial [Phycisphaerales bacterium]|nr:VWA domain-containing protein [Phycisphaerales bacterium]
MHWGNWHISFVHPAYLIVAAVLIPVIWLVSFRSLAGLGPVRRVLALTLRSLLVLLFAVALAEIQWVEKSDRVTVIYVLDQSESIPPAKRRLMLEYVVRQVRRHRNARQRDRAGVVVFGRQAVVEVPPFDDDLPPTTQVES